MCTGLSASCHCVGEYGQLVLVDVITQAKRTAVALNAGVDTASQRHKMKHVEEENIEATWGSGC